MNLKVSDFMTPGPHTIGQSQPVQKAHELMRSEGIRHLPVLEGGKLLGMLSLRDVDLLVGTDNVDESVVRVEEAMSGAAYEVGPDDDLGTVARHMVDNEYGSAVVTQGQKVVGVFTAVDALRALAKVLS